MGGAISICEHDYVTTMAMRLRKTELDVRQLQMQIRDMKSLHDAEAFNWQRMAGELKQLQKNYRRLETRLVDVEDVQTGKISVHLPRKSDSLTPVDLNVTNRKLW